MITLVLASRSLLPPYVLEPLQHDLYAFPEDGQVSVRVEPQDEGWWLVWFGDDGCRIDYWPDDSTAAQAVLWILADKLQDQVEERFRDAWPRCPTCRRSLSPDLDDRNSVWRCSLDGWTCPIGDFGRR